MSVKRHIIIPARLKSTRLPEKPLRYIGHEPMIVHVYRQALKCGFDSVCVATDDAKIAACIENIGGQVVMTSSQHTSGTARLAEVAHQKNYHDMDIIVNIQGDEPCIPPTNVQQVAQLLESDAQVPIATLSEPIHDIDSIFDSNCVKVIVNHQGHALYFSRAPIPWQRGSFEKSNALATQKLAGYQRHIGLYGYRAHFLKAFDQFDTCLLEDYEALEQLRFLWHGYTITVASANAATPPGVDTEADLNRVCQWLENSNDNQQ